MEATAEGLEGQAAFGGTYGMNGQQAQGTKALEEGNRIFQSEEDTVLRGPEAFHYLGGGYKTTVAGFPVMPVKRTRNYRHE